MSNSPPDDFLKVLQGGPGSYMWTPPTQTQKPEAVYDSSALAGKPFQIVDGPPPPKPEPGSLVTNIPPDQYAGPPVEHGGPKKAGGLKLYSTPEGQDIALTDAEAKRMMQPRGGPSGPDKFKVEGMRRIGVNEGLDQEANRRAVKALVVEKARQHAMGIDVARQEQAADQARREREAEIQNRVDEMDRFSREISEFKFNPNRAWDQKGAGGQLTSVLAMILGGIGAAMQGKQTNSVEQYLDRQMQMDFEAQKATFDAKRAGLGAAQNAYSVAVQKYGRGEQADAAAKASILDQYARQAQQLAADNKGTDLELASKRITEGAQEKRFDLMNQAAAGAAAAKPKPVDMKGLVQLPNGSYAYAAGDAKSLEDYHTQEEAYHEVLAHEQKVIALRQQLDYDKTGLWERLKGGAKDLVAKGGLNPDRDVLLKELDAEEGRLRLATIRAQGVRPTDKVIEMESKSTGNLHLRGPAGEAPLRTMEEQARAAVNRAGQRANLMPLDPGVNPKTGVAEFAPTPGMAFIQTPFGPIPVAAPQQPQGQPAYSRPIVSGKK